MSLGSCAQVPPLKLVANLPYNITKLAMRKLLPLGDNLSHLYLMLQVRPPPLLILLALVMHD